MPDVKESRCCKCGVWFHLCTPSMTYSAGTDRLLVVCGRCGFSWTAPTWESEEAARKGLGHE